MRGGLEKLPIAEVGKRGGEKRMSKIEDKTIIKTPTASIIIFIIGAILVAWIYLPPLIWRKPDSVIIALYYDGNWQGAVGCGNLIESYSGKGSDSWEATHKSNTIFIVSAVIQKMDDSYRTLRIEIRTKEGKILASASTSAPYGVASITHEIT